MKFNYLAFKAIYLHEMDRFKRTLMQSLFSPVLSTSLYFIVFGSVIGGYVEKIDGISYGSYIVPGLLMLTLLTQSITNTSFGIFFPKFNGTIYEILAAPISTLEIVLAFVGAGATKTLIVGVVIFVTANFFVEVDVKYPFLKVTDFGLSLLEIKAKILSAKSSSCSSMFAVPFPEVFIVIYCSPFSRGYPQGISQKREPSPININKSFTYRSNPITTQLHKLETNSRKPRRTMVCPDCCPDYWLEASVFHQNLSMCV